jgi:predicted ArsR family transcriptional regulator
VNIAQTVRILKALMQGPASRIELANRVGLHPKSVGRVLTELKAQKMIYVVDYSNTIDGRNRVKIYTFGEGEDAQPKSTQSQEDRSRKSYLRKVAANSVFTPLTTFVGGKSLWQ